MFAIAAMTNTSKPQFYMELLEQAQGLLQGEHDFIANAANLSALIYHCVADINWCGFYFYDGNELVVGPFQGKPACVRIALGKGVCGTAALTRKTQVVTDVHAFAGHIACDADSQSEIVVPLIKDDKLIGVWDVDSPRLARFDGDDRHGMEQLCALFLSSLRT